MDELLFRCLSLRPMLGHADPKHDDVTFHAETDGPTYPDDHKIYKVEKWTRDAVRWLSA